MPKAYSKKFMDDNRPKFPLLPTDEYILEVEKIDFETGKKFHSQEEEEKVNITFKIVSFRDGADAVDVDGKTVDEKRRMFLSARYDEEKGIGLGFMADGTPSKLRQFISCITGQNVLDDLIWDWDKMIGKEVPVQIDQYDKESGERGNKISRFIPPKSVRRPVGVKIDPKDIPVIDDSKKIDLGLDNTADEISVDQIPF
jgi:hypothetical protein